MTASSPDHQISIEVLTPRDCINLLQLNTNNRKIRDHKVEQYAAEMRAGRWQVTGEPIIVNGTTLLNGQHRLRACVLADVPFTTAVFRGAASDTFAVIDSGLSRTAGDVLAHAGHRNAATVAAAARLVIGYNTGTLSDTHRLAIEATRQEIQRETDSIRDVYEAATVLGKVAGKEGFNPSATAAFAVLLGEHVDDYDVGIDWTRSVVAGADLSLGDPRLALRRWTVASRRLPNVVHLSAFIRAFNAWGKQETRTIIKPWFRGTPFPQLENMSFVPATTGT